MTRVDAYLWFRRIVLSQHRPLDSRIWRSFECWLAEPGNREDMHGFLSSWTPPSETPSVCRIIDLMQLEGSLDVVRARRDRGQTLASHLHREPRLQALRARAIKAVALTARQFQVRYRRLARRWTGRMRSPRRSTESGSQASRAYMPDRLVRADEARQTF